MSVSNDEVCSYCFDVLHRHFDDKYVAKSVSKNNNNYGEISCPLFVTLKKSCRVNDDDGDDECEGKLRGCIGTFANVNLEEGLDTYTRSSAFKDSRFEPLVESELSSLCISVSLLTDFEEIADKYDWVVGTHGIKITFVVDDRRYNSTYLPDVASSQQWDQQKTIDSLIKKAGYTSSEGKQRVYDSIKAVRYQSKKYHLKHSQYVELRNKK
jgi:uncharacterized protein (TIGR00296 family)